MSYRVRNWSEYNKGLKQRSSLTFWISPDVLANWEVKEKTGKPGATATYTGYGPDSWKIQPYAESAVNTELQPPKN